MAYVPWFWPLVDLWQVSNRVIFATLNLIFKISPPYLHRGRICGHVIISLRFLSKSPRDTRWDIIRDDPITCRHPRKCVSDSAIRWCNPFMIQGGAPIQPSWLDQDTRLQQGYNSHNERSFNLLSPVGWRFNLVPEINKFQEILRGAFKKGKQTLLGFLLLLLFFTVLQLSSSTEDASRMTSVHISKVGVGGKPTKEVQLLLEKPFGGKSVTWMIKNAP